MLYRIFTPTIDKEPKKAEIRILFRYSTPTIDIEPIKATKNQPLQLIY